MEIEKRVKDAVYEVEDTIDTCLTKAIQTKGKNVFNLAKEVTFIRQEKVQLLLADAAQIAGKPLGVEAPSTTGQERVIN